MLNKAGESNAKCLIALVAVAALCVWRIPAYGAAADDACKLLTQAEINAVLGGRVGSGSSAGKTLCQWDVIGDAPGRSRRTASVALLTQRAYEMAKAPASRFTKTPVSGIGDEAVFGVVPNVQATLAVKKGGLMFLIRVQGFAIDQPQAIDLVQLKEKTLAQEVLAKL
jgi:hypothetical protein